MLATEMGMLGQVLLVSLVLGAGLPVLFGLGLRATAWGAGGDAEEHDAGEAPRPHPVGRLLGTLCFALALAGVLLGITVVVASGLGYEVDLGGGPLLVETS
jgi:hypothetical protein